MEGRSVREHGNNGNTRPLEVEVLVDMTPVDYVCQAIVHLSMQEGSSERIDHLVSPPPFRREPVRFDCENTLAGLRGSSITCPPVDHDLLNTYFTHFICNGFPAPPGHSLQTGKGECA